MFLGSTFGHRTRIPCERRPDVSVPDGEFEALLRQSQERVEKILGLRDQTRDLTGTAETPDGRIKVTCTSDDPVAELHIDPRAMRMPSGDLAAAIKETVRKALADRERQVEQLSSQEYGEDDPMALLSNKEAAMQALSEARTMFDRAGRDAQSMMDQLQQHLGLRPDANGRP
ncbi:YbaB/EbfC family nucleoid-associated protein [Actinomadura adrarensis]|uniref:YbaB/EbfC family nucleoid-associated protein n=1 Tax=Actinomadura adrarensis TaxID=1819600 RepID=A0ABW3C9F0_9ACTN